MDSVNKVLKKGTKRVRQALGQEVSSDSDNSDYADELPSYNPDLDIQLQERMRRHEETGRQRAESPTRMQLAHMEQRRIIKGRRRLARQEQAQAAQEQTSLRREAAEFTHNFEINEMIQRINAALGIDVDIVDPRIRFVIGQIVNAHGLTLHSLRLMRRSKILLSAISDIAGRGLVNAGEVVYSAGQAVLEALRAAGRLASHGASAVTSRLPSWREALSYLPISFSSQPRAPGQRARSPDSFLQVQGPPDLGFQEVRFSPQALTLEEQRRRQLEMGRMLQLQLSSAPNPASAFGRQSLSLQSQAPPPPPPPPPASTPAPAVEEEEDECSICMNPLRHNVVLTKCNHAFHSACVTPWLNSRGTCPMCRNTSPTPLVPAPAPAPAKRQRQGGGGSRKSRSKTKSKSKTRRLRKSRNKSRKSRKQKSSSYRRK
jgi:hypothetical protein